MSIPVINRYFQFPEMTEDVDYNRRVSLLHILSIFILIFEAFFIPISFIIGGLNDWIRILNIIILCMGVILRILVNAHKITAGSIWILVSGMLLITGGFVSLGAMTNPLPALYLIMIIIGGILFGLKAVIPLSIISSLCVGFLTWLFSAYDFFVPDYSEGTVSLVLYVLLFLMCGMLINFMVRASSEALNHARKQISERMLVEQKLRESESQYRSLFEQTHDAVFILDLAGNLQKVNQRAADMLGYTVDELLKLPREAVSADFQHTLNVENRLISGEHIPHFDRFLRKRDGSLLPVEIYAELARDELNQYNRIQIVARDISERRIAEEKLLAANDQLNHRIAEVEQLQKELQEQVIRDPLTGLYNRRYLTETLFREIARMKRDRLRLSVILIDIDRFKQINDNFGHAAGDYCLIDLARQFDLFTRESDMVCRMGGEEFIIVMPNADSANVEIRAEELRKLIEKHSIFYQEDLIKLTISIGAATYPDHANFPDELVSRADEALYESKRKGRNRVSVFGPPKPSAETE